MLEANWRDAIAIIALYQLIGPLAVRSTFRFTAYCKPCIVPVSELPENVASYITPRIPQMEILGFELVGCYDCGELATQTRSFNAYFCNRTTNEFANVTVAVSPRKAASYFEFSTRFKEGLAVETNTNGILPLTPGNPETRVFRFPEIHEPEILCQVHRRLTEKYAEGLWPQGEPKGMEIQRLVRVLENYGPRHVQMGYMIPEAGGESYRLTWKGAFLMAWRGMWSASMIRKIVQKHTMQAELRSLEQHGEAALQKA
jgi:hypothetical protein